jgi:RNA recognition motif-containing protein
MQGNKLYVGNLTYSVTEEQIEKLFAEQGQVVQVNLIGNKGFGFVEMSSSEDAEKAKEALNGFSLEGRTMIVDEARPKRETPRRNFESRRY